MAIVEMNHLTLLGLESERDDILRELMRFGLVEVTGVALSDDSPAVRPNPAARVQKAETSLSEVRDALTVLGRFYPEKKPLFSIRRELHQEECSRVLSESSKIWEAVSRIRTSEDEINRLKAEENRITNMKTSLTPWLALDMDVSSQGTRHVRVSLGTVPALSDLSALEVQLESAAPEAALSEQGVDNENRYLLLATHADAEQDALTVLKASGWNRIQFKDVTGTPGEAVGLIDARLRDIAVERTARIEEIGKDVNLRHDIEVLHDALIMDRDREAAVGKLAATRKTFLLEGWMPAKSVEKLTRRLDSRFTCHIDCRAPEAGEATPVAVTNNAFTESIQPVMNMYGTPSSLEIDPNGITMPFFIFFFGLIISDAGYGLILALGGFLVTRLFKLEAPTRRFAKLIMYCGLATMLCGVLFGGYFGIESLADYALWFNPGTEKGKNDMMAFCLAIGIVHLFTGHLMKALNLIRRGQILDAIFDVLFPVIMYAGFAMAVLPNVPGLDPAMTAPVSAMGLNVMIAGLVLSILVAGRKNKSIFGKAFGGLPKLYDIIAFLGDVLSYLRLLALSMSGAILGGLFNGLAMNGGLVFKLTAGLIILLLGHLINFAMGILGAFVHSCRLQYLEFFSKFLEGGGDPFRPLQANTRYITIKQEEE